MRRGTGWDHDYFHLPLYRSAAVFVCPRKGGVKCNLVHNETKKD